MSNLSTSLLRQYYGISNDSNESKQCLANYHKINYLFEEESDDEQLSTIENKNHESENIVNIVDDDDEEKVENELQTSNDTNILSGNVDLDDDRKSAFSLADFHELNLSSETSESLTTSSGTSGNINSRTDAINEIQEPVSKTSIDATQDDQLKENETLFNIKLDATLNDVYLDFSNRRITTLSLDIMDKVSDIKMLYLENNGIKQIPDTIFILLPHLEWFDIRRNKITSLPKTVKGHKHLETILLGNNELTELPLELGLVKNLKQCQLKDNPIVFPPSKILKLGFQSIVNFLREEWNRVCPDEKIEIIPLDESQRINASSNVKYRGIQDRYTE